jgi:TonB family protein
MRRMVAIALGMMLAASVVNARAQGAAQAPPTDDWGKLVEVNNLDVKGNTPFHMGMTFQLYDLSGKPSATGSFETWWTGVGRRRTVVTLAGLNGDGSAPEGADARTVRDAYLVSQLIELAIHPVPSMPSSAGMVTKPLRSGKFELECTSPKSSSTEAMDAQLGTVCVAPNTTDVLTMQGFGGHVTVLRPKTGKFHDTFVGIELRIYYLGRDAIAGKLTIMHANDSTDAKAATPVTTPSEPGVARISGEVIAGHRIKFVEPRYPEAAKISHSSGSVLMNAVIGKDGVVRRLVPIASTDSMFTDSAMDSVRQWKYSPYLLNGEPTEVDTTITLNFAINGG